MFTKVVFMFKTFLKWTWFPITVVIVGAVLNVLAATFTPQVVGVGVLGIFCAISTSALGAWLWEMRGYEHTPVDVDKIKPAPKEVVNA